MHALRTATAATAASPGYYPYYPRPCPPGTFWDHGACRHVPPPPHYGITIDVPPIIIR